jgi:hypothetical protein
MEVSPNSTTEPLNMYNYINSYFMNPITFIILFLVVVIIVAMSTSLGGNSNQFSDQTYNSERSVNVYGIIGVVVLVALFVLNGFQYYYGTDIFASIRNIFYGNPEIDIRLLSEQEYVSNGQIASKLKTSMTPLVSYGSVLNQNSPSLLGPGLESQTLLGSGLKSPSLLGSGLKSPSLLGPGLESPSLLGPGFESQTESSLAKGSDQVFNIPGNKYRYEDAKAVCSAYGGRLATYNELETAYNDGADWCNYGWSDRQMALFPTQKSTYNNLQNIKGHEHDCGRPGVNGGYIANPMVKFGVNCYGNKPKINKEEQHLMDITTPYPKTQADLVFEQNVSYWKTKLDDILVSPFNYNSWSKV